jgi:parvulin-like peptidyl-prolyl isomerase
MRRVLREPLLHFLMIGGALFIAYAIFHKTQIPSPPTTRIEITKGDADQIRQAWQMQWKRLPTKEELDGLIAGEIRERILSQEAMKLGLDQDDPIVRRRLAQKLEFLLQDVATLHEPTEDDLAGYFAKNRSTYTIPARLTFSHIYFSTTKHPDAEKDAKGALLRLQQDNVEAVTAAFGDPFLLDVQVQDKSLPEIEQMFGREFSLAVAALPSGDWQGPVRSTYGWHLVKVATRSEPRVPTLVEVRERVQKDLAEEQRRKTNDEAFERLKARYVIVVQDREPPSPVSLEPVASTEGVR